MEEIHSFFHVSTIYEFVSGPSEVLKEPEVEISRDLTYVEQLVRIMDT